MHRALSGYPLFAAFAMLAQSFFGGAPIDGIRCDAQEGAVEHIHTHLQLFDRGRAVGVPAGIGIPVDGSCLYWLHTHTDDGIIHIESPVRRTFTLGTFFDIWGMSLSARRAGSLQASRDRALRVTVDGRPWNGNPRAIPLRDHEEIVIQSGPPFARPHPTDWSNI